MIQASLPKALLIQKLSDLKVGESAWCTPWSMEVDQNAKLWLNTNASIVKARERTFSMKVTKTAAGWVCDISKCADYQWDDYGVADKHPPVVQLITK